jgi:hypothetical protein
MIIEEGARCCCVYISRNSCIEFSCLFHNIYFQRLFAGLGTRHPPDPSMSRVQINPLATNQWIPADLQPKSRGPYFDSRSQSARPCRLMGVASPRIKGPETKKNSQRVLKMFAAMLWIDLIESVILRRVIRQSHAGFPQVASPQPTSNSTVLTTIALGIAPSTAPRLPQPFATPMEMLERSLQNPVRFAPLHSGQPWA